MQILQILQERDLNSPQQLHQEVKNCLLPQTRLLRLTASNMNNPSEEDRREIGELTEGLYRNYLRVFSEYGDYIQNIICSIPEFQRCLEQILQARQLRHDVEPEVRPTPARPESHAQQPASPPPEPTPIDVNDLPASTNDEGWMSRMWGKACEVIFSLLEWLQYVFRGTRITSPN